MGTVGGSAERARTSVTRSIRYALDQLAEHVLAHQLVPGADDGALLVRQRHQRPGLFGRLDEGLLDVDRRARLELHRDHLVINDELGTAISEVVSILKSPQLADAHAWRAIPAPGDHTR